jgi:hypothetical protein
VSGPLGDVASGGGYVAVPTGNWTVEVYPLAGGAPVTITGVEDPQFEPGVLQPHLLLLQHATFELTIAATDGNAATMHPIAGDYLSFATWLGSAVVYGTVREPSRLVNIVALTNAGAVTTALASDVGSYAWAPLAAPSRLFYSREVASAGGPAGVFYVDLPR